MSKILMITVILIVAFSFFMFLFVRSGERIATKYPESRFSKWWRLHIIDQDPQEN
jgi:hypothetical protein